MALQAVGIGREDIFMKNGKSLVYKILLMVCATAFVTCLAVTAAGSMIIYISTDNEIKKEIKTAAMTLYNVYDMIYEGSYSVQDDLLCKGERVLTDSDFSEITHAIGSDSNIDFTVFLGDTRLMTSVRNADGSAAIGTKAAEEVVENVLEAGGDFFNSGVSVNGTRYMAYYIPIKNSAGQTIGMVFAGKPSDLASANVISMINIFMVISLVVLLIAVLVCAAFSNGMVKALLNIKKFMTGISSGDFTDTLDSVSLARTDEVGDIARSAVKLSEDLRSMVERDPLTMLLNRRACRIKMDKMLENGTVFTVIMGDIDFFKKINDTYGHSCGDDVLIGISLILKETASSNGGFVARWGGEEFVMALPDISVSDTETVLTALMDRIREFSVQSGSKTVNVTMTFGVTRCEPNGNIERSINRADELLYSGKQSGRNKVVTDRLMETAG